MTTNRTTRSTPSHRVVASAADRGLRVPTEISRRQLLQLLGIAAGGTALAGCSQGGSADGPSTSVQAASRVSPPPATKRGSAAKRPAAADPNQRVLVVIEMQGGHDGFAMLVPTGDARFRKLRDHVWIDPKELHHFDALGDRYAVAKGLAPVVANLSFVEGVGVAKPDLSHTAMMQRWWQGDASGEAGMLTGFLGRCCDVLANGEPLSGVSVGGGTAPALISASATTVSLPNLDGVREIAGDTPEAARLRQAISTLAKGSSGFGDETTDRFLALARHGLEASLDLSGIVGRIGAPPKSYPENEPLATSLAAVRQLISAGSGIRTFHIPWGSFDTHTNQVGTHNDHMIRLGAALSAFRDDLASNGLAERVLVATTSEFGRRAEANANGTDHGTASSMLLMGPVKAGRHGQPVDFGRLDSDGNARATVSLDDYYATLATWLGARPADVLPRPGTVIDTLF